MVFNHKLCIKLSSSALAELADLPLIRLDFSCNKITEIPAAYRKLRQLQHIILDNNPMQSPPAQVTHSSICAEYVCVSVSSITATYGDELAGRQHHLVDG